MLGYLYADRPGQLVPPESRFGRGWYDTGDIVTVDGEGIIAGTVVGARVADASIPTALVLIIVCYGLSLAATFADLTLALAIGIVIGAVLVPRLIPIERLRRARLAAYAMGGFILLLSQVEAVWPARVILVFVGITGGLFMVPVNAALQEIGHRTIGSGGAVALQNFFENTAMLATVGLYTIAAAHDAPPVGSVITVGGLVLVATAWVSWRLPPDPSAFPQSEVRNG